MRGEPRAAALADAYDLTVIRCRLLLPHADEPKAEPSVDIRLRRGEKFLSAPMVVPASEMQLPPTLSAVAKKAGVYGAQIPDWVFDELGAALRDVEEDEPLWFRLGSPTGHLAAVPWEYLLRRGLKRAILRVPFSTIRPVISQSRLHVALCAVEGRPDAHYELIESTRPVLRRMVECFPDGTHIHVFTLDEAVRAEAGSMSEDVIVHLPDTLGDDPLPEPLLDQTAATGIAGRLDNPWLRWMLRATSPDALDVVHFVCPGYLSSSYGALDFGRAPLAESEDSSLRFVTAGQLIAFLTRAGTWGTAFTIPNGNAWPAGLRILAHRVARLRPGPLVVHAPHYAPDTHDEMLLAAYRVAFTEELDAPPRTHAISLYVHPEQIPVSARRSPATVSVLKEQAKKLTLEGTASEQLLVQGSAPAWLAANQRALESWAAEVTPAPAERHSAADQGVIDALAFVSNLLSDAGGPP